MACKPNETKINPSKKKRLINFKFSTDEDNDSCTQFQPAVKCHGSAGKGFKKGKPAKRMKKQTRAKLTPRNSQQDSSSDVQIIDYIPGNKDSDIEVIDFIPGCGEDQVKITKVEYVDKKNRRKLYGGKEMMGLTVDVDTGAIDVIQNQMDDPRVFDMEYNGIDIFLQLVNEYCQLTMNVII